MQERFQAHVATIAGVGGPAAGFWAWFNHVNEVVVILSTYVGFVVGCLSLAWWVRKWWKELKK